MSDPLFLFLDEFADRPLDQLADLITELVAQGCGIITKPEPSLHSPATAVWEIECLGVYATGFDRLHAARNWRKVAFSTAYPEVAA